MLISKRRLRWTAIGLLIVCALLMLRPSRSWIERAWVARALSPQLSVGELVVYSQESVIEVRDLNWHVDGYIGPESIGTGVSGRAFGVNARRCWLGVDRDSLPSGQLRFPKVILQEANLYLAKSLPSDDNCMEEWRQQLARHIVNFDWETIQRQMSCLPATEKLRLEWSGRIEGWVQRSREILEAAAQLEHQVEAMDNPLRFEESIRARLARFQQLADEQRILGIHLEQLESSLVTESIRLNQLHQQDLQTLSEQSTESKLKHTIDRNHADFEQELAIVLGDAVWNQLAPYGEVVDNVSHTAASFRSADYDVTVRAVEHGTEHLQRSELKATGEFQAGRVKARYQTRGTWRIAQNAPAQTFREFNFSTDFQDATKQLVVSSQYDSRQSPCTQLQIVMAEGPQPTAKLTDSSPSDQASGLTQATQTTQATLASDAGKLTGSLRVAPSSLRLLPWELPAELLDSIAGGLNQPLLFELSGDWDQPGLRLSGSAPAWLQRAVERLATEHSQAAMAKSQLQLDSEFNNQLLQLRQLVAVALREARQATASDAKSLLASEERMRKQIDLTSGIEFARRPGAVTR